MMQFRRPSGIPINMTRHETNAAASVLADAIRGMVSVPPGFCGLLATGGGK